MTLGLELMSFYTDDEDQITQLEIGMPIDAKDLDTKPIMFYHIDHVRKRNDEFCDVISGGIEYCIAESYNSVNQKIQERQTFKIN